MNACAMRAVPGNIANERPRNEGSKIANEAVQLPMNACAMRAVPGNIANERPRNEGACKNCNQRPCN